MMEAEIDLREYIKILMRHWKWIVGGAMTAAVATLVVSFLIPPTYETTALAVVTQPRYVMQFDPRFEPTKNKPVYQAYPELATSDDLLQELVDQLTSLSGDVKTLADLRKMVDAESGRDPSIVRLTVRSRSPEEAARIANAWATIFITRANDIYGSYSEVQVEHFESQMEQAETDLKAAEEALIAFQAHNRTAILQNQLNSYHQAQADYLADQRAITSLTQDIQGLREQLSQQPGDHPTTLADDLTALFLQIKAFNVQTSLPIQLQVGSAESLSNKNISEQIAFLDGLMDALQSKSLEIDKELQALEPKILTLQQQLQEIETEENRLTRDQEVAEEAYMALARKVEEVRIAAEAEGGDVKLASQAAVPEEPVSPHKLLNTAVGGVLGATLGIFWAFAVEWWRQAEGAPAQGKRGELTSN